jgi:flagellar protein FlaI
VQLLGKKKIKLPEKKDEGVPGEALLGVLGMRRYRVPEGYEELQKYPLNPPFSYCIIARNSENSEHIYIIDELALTMEERETLGNLREVCERDLQAPREEQTLREALKEQVPLILDSNKKLVKGLTPIGLKKVIYYLERDIAGFGKIDAFMHDINIEDVSCTGFGKPLYVFHRNFENIRTNIQFGEEEINDYIMRLVHKSGKHVSLAFPIVDATLPGRHRLAVTYGTEVTPAGTSFTIRKFRADPLTIVDLIKGETLSETIAAYLWLLMENKYSAMILGSTGAGKTTALNAIACLVHPGYKVISVEEVAEVNLPHENWISSISRPGFGMEKTGEIALFDLIKSAVRHRPDLIIVGEIRGDEAYVLFQSLATGHGGLTTMHADSPDIALKRLTQPPMNIPHSILSLMNCMIIVKHVRSPVFLEGAVRSSSRKFVNISEIRQGGSLNEVANWVPSSDTFNTNFESSYLLGQIALSLDLSVDYLINEMERRKDILMWMVNRNIRDYRSVYSVLNQYYNDPVHMHEKAIQSL